MNTETGQFHDLGDPATKMVLDEETKKLLADIMENCGGAGEALETALASGDIHAQVRKLGWLEFKMNEILSIKGHDFRVVQIRESAIILQSVKFVDPSAKTKKDPRDDARPFA